jgi:predicted RNA-binding protein with PIN domain
MTTEHLLVDSYNVINVWPELRELGNSQHALFA